LIEKHKPPVIHYWIVR